MSFVARSPAVTSEMLSSVKFAGTGAAPVSGQILQEFIDKTKGANTLVKNGTVCVLKKMNCIYVPVQNIFVTQI